MRFPQLTAMTFNLLYTSGSDPADESEPGTWPQRRPLMRRVIEKHAPDIVGFQEVESEQLVDLKYDLELYDCSDGARNGTDRSPMWAKTIAPPLLALAALGATQNHKVWRAIGAIAAIKALALIVLAVMQKKAKGAAVDNGGYCPIFWNKIRFSLRNEGTFWISHAPNRPDSVMMGAWLPRICHWVELHDKQSDEMLQVFNVHLDWWLLARARGGQIVARQMNEKWNGSPQLLLGDFNAPRQSATWNYLLDEATQDKHLPLHDAWSHADEQVGPKETFHGGDGEPQFPGRIDHILIRPAAPILKIITEELHEGQIYPSDHFPLVAQIGDSSPQ